MESEEKMKVDLFRATPLACSDATLHRFALNSHGLGKRQSEADGYKPHYFQQEVCTYVGTDAVHLAGSMGLILSGSIISQVVPTMPLIQMTHSSSGTTLVAHSTSLVAR